MAAARLYAPGCRTGRSSTYGGELERHGAARLGVDIGGTFTDVALETRRAAAFTTKVSDHRRARSRA